MTLARTFVWFLRIIAERSHKEANTELSYIPSSQNFFTEDEVSRVTGICLEHLRKLAQLRHLGSLVRAAEAAGAEAEKWLFTKSELMILNALCPRCDH